MAEVCYGCGLEAAEQPLVGVMARAEVAPEGPSVDPNPAGLFVYVPVCALCHADPLHRIWHPIKGHFFPRFAATMATEMAGSPNIGG